MARWEWVKLSSTIHGNARLQLAGRDARDTFIWLLCLNGQLAADGVIGAKHVRPEIVSHVVGMTIEAAKEALEALVEFDLVARTPDGGVSLLGWDEEWRPTNIKERQRLRDWRSKQNDSTGETYANVPVRTRTLTYGEKRRDQKRSEEIRVAAPPRRAVSLEAQKVAERLGAAIWSHMPECRELKNPDTFGRWARDIDLAMRIDGRTEADLINVIEWCHLSPDGAFWRGNVLSGRKLREKYDTIAAQMARPKANGTGPHVVMVPTTGKNIPRDLPPDKRIGELDAKTAVGELMLRLRYEPQGGK